MLLNDARQAIKEEAPLERLRSLTAELQQIYHSLGAGSGQPQGGGAPYGAPGGGTDGRDAPVDDDDVIDAEFTAS
jgi:molecular chaperone DnaK